MKGKIKWLSNSVLLKKRIFLFCFGGKCMSGRITEIKKSGVASEFEILVNFIEPNYFQDELVVGNSFTINEASTILGKGKVKEIVRN